MPFSRGSSQICTGFESELPWTLTWMFISGGWTRYGYLDFNIVGTQTYDKIITDNVLMISKTHQKNVILSVEALREFQNKTSFKQIRYTCSSGKHVVDFATEYNSRLFKYFLYTGVGKPGNACGKYYLTERHNSTLFQNCQMKVENQNYLFDQVERNNAFKYAYLSEYQCDTSKNEGEFQFFLR